MSSCIPLCSRLENPGTKCGLLLPEAYAVITLPRDNGPKPSQTFCSQLHAVGGLLPSKTARTCQCHRHKALTE